MCAFPCPWMPAMPTRITSLAPSTRPEALVPAMVKSGKAALATAVRLRKFRRVILFIKDFLLFGSLLSGLFLLHPHLQVGHRPGPILSFALRANDVLSRLGES